MNKQYISPQQLLQDAFRLGLQIFDSGYRPDYIVGVWRGGAPVAIAIQELFAVLGVTADHIAVRTRSYHGMAQRGTGVAVDGLDYLTSRLRATDKLLVVDDVHDTGLSLQQLVAELSHGCGVNTPEIRIATPWFKPGNTRSAQTPDYFLHRSDDWLVFPHELDGLTTAELRAHKPALAPIMDRLTALLRRPG